MRGVVKSRQDVLDLETHVLGGRVAMQRVDGERARRDSEHLGARPFGVERLERQVSRGEAAEHRNFVVSLP